MRLPSNILAIAVFALTASACRPEPGPATDVDAGAVSPDIGGKADGPTGQDTARGLGTSDADGYRFAGDWVELELQSGEVIAGELVATYDTSVWWNPLGSDLYAIFDAAEFAAYPDDRSFRFVEAADVIEQRAAEPPTPRPTYRDFLRNNAIAFEAPPFADTSYVITAHETYHLEEDGFGNFAWDFEITDDEGVRFTGDGASNEDFLVWQAPVFSGVRGTIIEIIDDGPDNTPGSHPEPDVAINNMVGIALGGHFYAYYLHFEEGGVEPGLQVGNTVDIGDRLGVVGNSGVSLEPHLHVVLLWYDVDADRSYSVPVEFADIETSTSPTGPFDRYMWWVPDSGEWLRP